MTTTSVIVSTYNQPEWLTKVLWGFHYQTHQEFEIIIADDGSSSTTAQKIEETKAQTHLNIIHLWQPDDGFKKNTILNTAIQAASGNYLVFTDGDCVPRADFLTAHLQAAENGYFLSGGYFKLPLSISQAITREDIRSGCAFNSQWLIQQGLQKNHKLFKLTSTGLKARLLNALTPTKATWNGHNASGWKKDIISVNGFDERMQYGGEDRELGERLVNKGIKSKQIRYNAVCVHLDHARSYVKPEMLTKNLEIRKITKNERRIWADDGINKYDD